ncbi:MAG TPA: hypothetical protein VGK67_19580 [Myxococcales bacterium]|jgi:hypothetical protein
MKTLRLSPLLFASLFAAAALAASCGAATDPVPAPDAGPTEAPDASEPPDAALPAGPDAAVPVDKAASCASTFGASLTNAFGRLDGTVLAIVKPTDSQCPIPNSDHLVIQVQVAGEAYRMVVNVVSDGRNGTDTRLKYLETPHALQGDPWSEGWHPGASVDYPGDLGAHVDAFTPHAMTELVELVSARLNLGDRISIYATSKDRPSSAHLIHRNQGGAANDDGAIVIGPDTAEPLWLVFAFDGTSF